VKNSSHLPAYEDGTVFRNIGIYNSDAGELPRRKHETFRTWWKFEIRNHHIYNEQFLNTFTLDQSCFTSHNNCRTLHL